MKGGEGAVPLGASAALRSGSRKLIKMWTKQIRTKPSQKKTKWKKKETKEKKISDKEANKAAFPTIGRYPRETMIGHSSCISREEKNKTREN